MLPKSAVTITRKVVVSSFDSYATEIETTIFTGLMRIVNVDQSNPYNQIQVHAKAEYLAYIEKGMPELFLGDIIEFQAVNDYSGTKKIVIKKIKPMTLTIQNKIAEAYCDSYNN
jgi:hypothetical protein